MLWWTESITRVKESHKEELCIHMSPLCRKSPLCFPAPSCVVLACPDGWGLKDANVHARAADLPQRLTLHQWKWKPVNQQAAVALIPAHHSLWHWQEHINHKHRPKHCTVGTVVSHPFIHLALTLTHAHAHTHALTHIYNIYTNDEMDMQGQAFMGAQKHRLTIS